MIAEMQGVIRGGSIFANIADITKYNGKTVTIIVNDANTSELEGNDPFLDALESDSLVMPTELGNRADDYVMELRADDRI